jgi:hypothetical protein
VSFFAKERGRASIALLYFQCLTDTQHAANQRKPFTVSELHTLDPLLTRSLKVILLVFSRLRTLCTKNRGVGYPALSKNPAEGGHRLASWKKCGVPRFFSKRQKRPEFRSQLTVLTPFSHTFLEDSSNFPSFPSINWQAVRPRFAVPRARDPQRYGANLPKAAEPSLGSIQVHLRPGRKGQQRKPPR